MLRLAVITDVHFGPKASFGGKLRKLSHLGPPLTRAFAAKMRDETRPDVIVNLGDCIEDESAELDRKRYAAFVELLRESDRELVHVAGNHDLKNLAAGDLLPIWGREAPLHYSLDRGGVHLVVLHTQEETGVRVGIDAAQLAWLEADLARSTLPAVVLMHHSAADQDLRGNRWFEGLPQLCLVAERAALRAILARHGRTLLVVNGHLHWNHLDVIEGIPYVTVQSLIENVEDDAPGTPAAAHALITIDGPRVLVEVAGAHPARYQFELRIP
jgi:3',5'-cyclic AMP phosphodiesterase CpdA